MKKKIILLAPFAILAGLFAASADDKPQPIGYSDTPLIPGTKWKVHDIDRPRPAAVAPGAKLGDALRKRLELTMIFGAEANLRLDRILPPPVNIEPLLRRMTQPAFVPLAVLQQAQLGEQLANQRRLFVRNGHVVRGPRIRADLVAA